VAQPIIPPVEKLSPTERRHFLGGVLGILAGVSGIMAVIFFGVSFGSDDKPPLFVAAVVSAALAVSLGIGAARFLPRRKLGSFAEEWNAFLIPPPPDTPWHRSARMLARIFAMPGRVVRTVAPFSIPAFAVRKEGVPWGVAAPVGLACGCLFWAAWHYGSQWLRRLADRSRERQYG